MFVVAQWSNGWFTIMGSMTFILIFVFLSYVKNKGELPHKIYANMVFAVVKKNPLQIQMFVACHITNFWMEY